VIYEISLMSNSKLYVGNLSFKTTEDELRSHFGQFGSVTDVYVAMDKMTGRPRGFAFVTMGTPEEAKVAAEKINGSELGGRQLTVNEARPKEDRPAGGFGGGGGGGRGFGGGGGGGGRGGYGGGGGGGRDRGERRY
jgi:cold-inducible RNA-binding protein